MIRLKLLGKNHIDTAMAFFRQGEVFKLLDDWKVARDSFLRALPVLEKTTGRERETYETMVHIGGTFFMEGAESKALKWRLKAYRYGAEKRVSPETQLEQQLAVSYQRTVLSQNKSFEIWLAEQSETFDSNQTIDNQKESLA